MGTTTNSAPCEELMRRAERILLATFRTIHTDSCTESGYGRAERVVLATKESYTVTTARETNTEGLSSDPV